MMRLRLACCAFLLIPMSVVHAQSQHDQSVRSEIKSRLDAAFALPGDIEISTRIQTALAKVTEKRDTPGKSGDKVLRDAEYYLHGLYGASARDWAHIAPTVGTPFYNAIKWAALRCRDAGFPELEKMMRTQPGNPVSEPGGTDWAYRGLKDGLSIDGKQKVAPRSGGHGLSLSALGNAAACTLQ